MIVWIKLYLGCSVAIILVYKIYNGKKAQCRITTFFKKKLLLSYGYKSIKLYVNMTVLHMKSITN